MYVCLVYSCWWFS